MIREIKFRGKRIDNGEWIIGDILQYPDDGACEIIENFKEQAWVDPATVGQFTELLDQNGAEAFEGDIFKDNKGVIRTIFWREGGFVCESNPDSFGYGFQGNLNPTEALCDQQTSSWFESNCVIIGNIHDNSELLQL